ncbi:unnamed protein product [Closterium sp. NIES-65]|nr:unnamed protein product [Closterium sp. NIES-65]
MGWGNTWHVQKWGHMKALQVGVGMHAHSEIAWGESEEMGEYLSPDDPVDVSIHETVESGLEDGLPDAEFFPAAAFFADDEEEEATFDTRFEVFRFIAHCNRGAGLSAPDVVEFFRLLNHPKFDRQAIADWAGKAAVDKFAEEELRIEKIKFKTAVIRVAGWPKSFTVKFLDGVEALRRMWADPRNAPGFVHRAAEKLDVNNKRVYAEAHTASFWIDAQDGLGPRECICPLILSSDETHLSVKVLLQLNAAWGMWAGNSNATTTCSAWAGVTCSPKGLVVSL